MPVADTGATVLTALLAVVLVGGYVALWAIWHFGFRGRGDEADRAPRPHDDG